MRIKIPLHISGFWVPHVTNNPLTTGSLGAGITLEPPVEAEIKKDALKDEVLVNSSVLKHDIVNVVKRIVGADRVYAEITSPSHLGEGLGFSAALSIVIAASALSNLGKPLTLNKVGVIAHEAEVSLMTGLGDVVAELRGGGLVVRLKPGAPGVSELDVVPVRDSISIIPCIIKREMTTPQMLRDYWSSIKEAGERAFRKFIAEPTFDRFLELSVEFSRAVFMSKETEEKLKETLHKHLSSGDVITYFIKKGTLVVISDKPDEELMSVLRRSFSRVLGIFKLTHEGTSIKI
ncbi:MAG: hypothetical protein QW417_02875 [Zestosphaera sp.]